MQFIQQPFDINGLSVPASMLEGMTRFPSFYEPFLRLTQTPEKEKKNKCVGEKVLVSDVNFVITEKIDGSNCQVVGWQDSGGNNHMIVRSRTELCACPEDKIWRDEEGLVGILMPNIDSIERYMFANYPRTLWSLCMEVYGPGANKNSCDYSFQKEARLFGCRLFSDQTIDIFLSTQREKYDSLRRINKYCPYLSWNKIVDIAKGIGIETTPKLGEIHSNDIQTPEDAVLLLEKYRESTVAKAIGKSKIVEGIVLWSDADYTHPDQGGVMAVYKIKFSDFPLNMFSSGK